MNAPISSVLLLSTNCKLGLPDRVHLPKSGLYADRGNIYNTIRRHYAQHFRSVASAVVTDRSTKAKLIDIAKVAEKEIKARLLERHDDWLEVLDSALEVVEKHFAKSQKALKLLELDQDIKEFSKGIHARAASRSKVAKRAKRTILNLVEDLQGFVHDQ